MCVVSIDLATFCFWTTYVYSHQECRSPKSVTKWQNFTSNLLVKFWKDHSKFI